MKKIIALALTVLIALSCLTACGKAPSGTEAGKEIKVGICNYVDDASLNQIVDNIQSRLKEIGEENGVTFNVSYDNCNADANLMNQIISNFIADGVDIMVGVATPVAMAMQAACEAQPGTMAAILGLEDHVVEEICASVDGIVVAANYNCPGQLVISGAVEAVDAACEKAKAAGARRALRLPVGGAFHSPLMEPAKQELEKAISEAPFQTPVCPIYQNVDAKPYTDPAQIKANLIAQLTAPVRWTYIVKNMLADGVTEFTELGPGTVLQGLIRKVNPEAVVESKSTL